MDIDNEILIGFDLLPKKTATINGIAVEVLFNQGNFKDNKVLGGYEGEDAFFLFVKTSLLTNPKALKGKSLILDGNKLRIVNVVWGTAICHLQCQSENKL